MMFLVIIIAVIVIAVLILKLGAAKLQINRDVQSRFMNLKDVYAPRRPEMKHGDLYDSRVLSARKLTDGKSRYNVDPIENDDRYAAILASAEREIEEVLKGRRRGMGSCHRYWRTKKQILEEKYGVIWFSPAEMNPSILFD